MTIKLVNGQGAGVEVYKKFNNPGILDDFIKENGLKGSLYSHSSKSVKNPLSTKITVPNTKLPITDTYEPVKTNIYHTYSTPKPRPANGTVIAVNGTLPRPTSTPVTTAPKTVTYVRLVKKDAPTHILPARPMTSFSPVYDPSHQITHRPNSILKTRKSEPLPVSQTYHPVQETPIVKPILKNSQVGSVQVHIDNISKSSASPSPSITPATMSPVVSSSGSTKRRDHSPASLAGSMDSSRRGSLERMNSEPFTQL